MNGNRETGLFAFEVFSLIILRESDIDIFCFFGLHTDQLLFKARDEGMGTDDQVIVFTLAAVKRYII